jgi:hypothetical protein
LIQVDQNAEQQNAYLMGSQMQGIKISLIPQKSFISRDFALYCILLEGNIYNLDRSLNLITEEFGSEITNVNNLLNIFYKLGHKPLGYAEIEK